MDKRVAAVLALGLVLAASLSPVLIPFCMDEFVHYRGLGCAVHPLTVRFYPFGCERYDLRLPLLDAYLPLRSYDYIGSLPVIPFLPFWKAIGSPVAARVQGAFYLLGVAFLLARLGRVSFGAALAATLLIPAFALAHIVDLGPVGISLTLVLAAALLLRRAVGEAHVGGAALWGALAGIAVFLGFTVKPIFVWALPAVALLTWHGARTGGRTSRRPVMAALGAAAALAIPLALLLLFAEDREGLRYLEVMREGNLSLGARNRFALIRVTRYLLDGAAILPRSLTLQRELIDRIPVLLAGVLLVAACSVRRESRRRIGGFVALALLTLAVTITTRSAWGPHHAAYWLLFLVAALAVAIDRLWAARRPWALLALAVSAIYWSTLLVRLPGADVEADSNRAKDALLDTLDREAGQRATVEVHISWGTYLIAHLFDRPAQIVLALPLRGRPELVDDVRRIARQSGRPVDVVGFCPAVAAVEPPVRRALGGSVRWRVVGNWCAAEFGF